MISDVFSKENLKKKILYNENKKINCNNIDLILNDAMNRVDEGFINNFKIIESTRLNKTIFTPSKISDKLVIRLIADNINKATNKTPASRESIIENLIQILEDKSPFKIIRLDICSFYESIKIKDVLSMLKKDLSVSLTTYRLTKDILKYCKHNGCNGIPRGISVSSALSEYVLKNFDTKVNSNDAVFFYARFVDDIIIASTDNLSENNYKDIKPPFNLKYNIKKTQVYDIDSNANSINFTFLGYQFDISNTNNNRNITVSIAQNKINKIKTRVNLSLLDYKINRDFNLLLCRIKFLTSNYYIYKVVSKTKFKAGIYYSHKSINNHECLKKLDNFMKYLFLGNNIDIMKNTSFTRKQLKQLLSYKFTNGYKNKIIYNFKPSELQTIQRCWKYA